MFKFKKIVLACTVLSVLIGVVTAGNTVGKVYDIPDSIPQPDTNIFVVIDSALPMPRKERVTAQIHMLARTYRDSIVIRWAGEDYITQRKLNQSGVNLYRLDLTEYRFDTLAYGLKPWSLEQMRAVYPESDSVAYMAMGLLYGENGMTPDQTRNEPGSLGAYLELHDDQQARFGFGVLLSEWRRDIADRMAMRYVDLDVVPGHKYEYVLQPTEIDSLSSIVMGAGHLPEVVNEPYKKENYDIQLGDSIVGPFSVRLWWIDKTHSTYEIERRKVGTAEWTRVNSMPYLMMSISMEGNDDCFFKDIVPEAGDYEYRVFAHDAFGDLTNPSPTHKVHVPDIVGPKSPLIRYIEINHTDSTDLSKGVTATFHIEKDSIEDDFMGFMPMYYNQKVTGNEWKKLAKDYFGANDTVFTVDVTGLPAGMVTVGAFDNEGNGSYSIPQLMSLKDVKAPDAPRNFKAVANANDGTITLTWDSDEDDIEYYEVAFANDTTHKFMLKTEGKLKEKMFVDSVDMTVNQKYIYYKVRAIDYSTNEGDYTPVLQVVRPSILPPSEAHLESSSVEDDGIHMRWGCGNDQQLDYHLLLRRLESRPNDWTVIARWDADSVNALGGMVDVVDRPEYNRDDRYVYAVCTFGLNGMDVLSTQLSMAWEGDALFEWKIKLFGDFDEKEGCTILAWELDDKLPFKGEWYYCIFKKQENDTRPKFLISADANKRSHTNYILRSGESADFYIMIQYKDGRKSFPSNTVTIKAPKKQ
ncbi:MAG: hypothetical protein KBT29_02200 [Prevotellaceae bacterium]|nr:hypothetical protein [Candidatus Minthosoma caballi]